MDVDYGSLLAVTTLEWESILIGKHTFQRKSLTQPSFLPSLCEYYLELFLGSQDWTAAPPPAGLPWKLVVFS